MKLRPLTGAITALATPFRNQAVAHDDLRRLADYQDLKITPDQQFRLLDAMGIDVQPE